MLSITVLTLMMHLIANKLSSVSKLICSELAVDAKTSAELIKLGAVYFKSGADSAIISLNDSQVGNGSKSKITQQTQIQKPQRIFEDITLYPGDYLRVYPNPKRYLQNLTSIGNTDNFVAIKILEDNENYMIVNKPPGLPVHPTVDNYYQNLLQVLKRRDIVKCLEHKASVDRSKSTFVETQSEIIEAKETALNSEKVYTDNKMPVQVHCDEKNNSTNASSGDLFLPQRLDTDTSGLIILTKTKSFNKHYAKTLRRREVQKKYKALLASNGPLNGDMLKLNSDVVHYQRKSSTSPRVFKSFSTGDELECVLQIESLSPLVAKNKEEWIELIGKLITDPLREKSGSYYSHQMKEAMNSWLRPYECQELAFQEATIRLITGRTHQIRGQIQVN